MEQSYDLNLLFELPSVKVVNYANKKTSSVQSGPLAVYQIKKLNLFLIQVNDWKYTLNKELPVMKEQQKSYQQSIYIFPQEDSHIGIIVDKNTSFELIDCFESVLHEQANLVVPDQEQLIVDAVKGGHIDHPELMAKMSLEEEKEEKVTSAKIGAFIHLGGDYLRQGIISGAKLVSEGIKVGGQFIQTKITKPKPVKVDEKTMQKIRGAHTTSSIMLQYSRTQIEALYTALKTAGKAVGKELETSDTGVKIKSNEHYDDAKNVAKGTVHAFAAVYDGCFEALCEIGRGCGEATVGIVDKQYGHEASEATKEGLQVVGNVGYIAKSAQDVVTKDIVKETKNQTYDGQKPSLQ